MKDNSDVFFRNEIYNTLKRLWNESLNAWRFANKLFNQTVMGKQAFVNTSYLKSFMKTNTCPRGKKKLDCITSLDIQYLKKKYYENFNFCELQNDIPCIFLLQIERNPTQVMNLRVIGKIY